MAREMFSWRDGNRYVSEMGGEDHLAARIEAERGKREWSQSELARQMVDVGCPVNQTSISKIEKLRGRRAISVDELIAFAKVFDLPAGELVLPESVLRSVKARQALSEGQEALQAKQQADDRYDTVLRDIANGALDDTDLMQSLIELRDRAEAQTQRDTAPRPAQMKERPSFIRDVFRAVDTMRERRDSAQRTNAAEALP